MSELPSTADSNGRKTDGTFARGHKLAKGNPFAKKTAQIRAALFKCITVEDIRIAAMAQIKKAKKGDRFAFAEILDRTIGKPINADPEAAEKALAILIDRSINVSMEKIDYNVLAEKIIQYASDANSRRDAADSGGESIHTDKALSDTTAISRVARS